MEVDEALIAKTLEIMIENKDLIKDLICENSVDTNAEVDTPDTSAIYLPVFYYSEVGTANRLLRLLSANKGRSADNADNVDMAGLINEWATVASKVASNAIHYDETQLRAIRAAIENKVLVLTGGPGTVKTTTHSDRNDRDNRDNHASDFLFVAEEEGETAAKRSEKAADRIINLCIQVLPRQGINVEDIQVLTPMRRCSIGSANLNLRLQAALNPEGLSLKRAGVDYRVGDKVMQIRNNYEKAVFNGDIGFTSKVNLENNELTVSFDERSVVYDVNELDELVLAYATTIHKLQGSEFPYVVMPLMMSHYIMLQMNLLYTGVTRVKRGLILVGEKKAVFIAVKNNKIEARNTGLSERLQNKYL